jgi:hypothetical protein
VHDTLITGLVGLSFLAGCNTYNNTAANNEALMRMGGAMYSNALGLSAPQKARLVTDVYDYQGNYAGYISNGLVFDNQNYQVGTVQGGIIYNNNNFQIGSIQNGTIYWD